MAVKPTGGPGGAGPVDPSGEQPVDEQKLLSALGRSGDRAATRERLAARFPDLAAALDAHDSATRTS